WEGWRRRRIALQILLGFVILFLPIWWFGNDVLRAWQSAAPSVAYGTSSNGHLAHGKRLPSSGPNFHTYSRLGSLLGRTAVHSTVEATLLEGYTVMAARHPEVTFQFGETGFPEGGEFRPHRSHRNGTAVDLFVPVRDAQGRSAQLPIAPWNEFGYWIEFDSAGRWHDYTIDFPLLAEHLLVLDSIARVHDAPITRVILAPEFQDELAGSPEGREALRRLPWMTAKPWVRHDEHYHIDFGVPTRPISGR
ncbi:MAG TPA: penicillin-insensitive murein endopeptidase, partial [Gemmatimonadales bacterium]